MGIALWVCPNGPRKPFEASDQAPSFGATCAADRLQLDADGFLSAFRGLPEPASEPRRIRRLEWPTTGKTNMKRWVKMCTQNGCPTKGENQRLTPA